MSYESKFWLKMELLVVIIMTLSIQSNAVYGYTVENMCQTLPSHLECGEQFFLAEKFTSKADKNTTSMIRAGEFPW